MQYYVDISRDYGRFSTLIACLLLMPLGMSAQIAHHIVLDTGAEITQVDLNPDLLIVADPTDSLEIEALLEVPLNAAAPAELKPQQPLPKGQSYWGAVEIENNFDYPTSWIASTGGLDLVEFYLVDDNEEIEYQKTGRMVPVSERGMMLGNNLENRFKFSMPKAGKYRLFFKMKNYFGIPVSFDVSITRLSAWEKSMLKSEVNRQLLFGFTAGLFIIMLLYNFLLFVVSNDKVYLYYSLYIFFPLMYLVNANGILLYTPLGELPIGYLYTRSITPAAALIAYLIFMRHFLDTKQLLGERVDNAITRLYALEVLNIAFIFVGVTLGIDEKIYRVGSVLVHVVVFVGVIWLLILLLKTGERLAQYFTLGASFFIFSACFFAFVMLSGMLPMEVGMIAQTMGIAGELITFSLGLGYRIRMIERERANAQEENARLLAEQNETLERKVMERTAEIEKQKEEMLTQNEELYQQQEEIIAQRDYIEEQKAELQEQNLRMVDSIRYAKTIQQSILPLEGHFDQYFSEYFLLYRPKDIVSGDFYWLLRSENKTYLAVVDCTGHGVPGAFMSLVGSTVLDDIINKEHIYDPAEILEHLNTSVQLLLKQDGENRNQDGMDLCLCLLEEVDLLDGEGPQVRVIFAGAKRPLYYTSQGVEGLQELKGSRKSIGGMQFKDKRFEEESILLKKGDCLYLTTDGYVDQHNMKGKKIGSPRLLQKMTEVKDLPMTEQELQFEAYLEAHQSGQLQRDDITIVGVRL